MTCSALAFPATPLNEIRLFVASPSDCQRERDIVRSIAAELNEVFCPSFSIRLVPVGWESIAPSLGSPQDVIDGAIGPYDILVGAMWLRFGTPTADGSGSGTEHEFNNAYELWTRTGRPHVLFYFNDAPPEHMRDLDISQYQQVCAFREKLHNIALVKHYEGSKDFELLLRLDLQRVIRTIAATRLPNTLSAELIPPAAGRPLPAIAPLFFHSSVLPRHFVERSAVDGVIAVLQAKLVEAPAPSVLSVIGIGGSGKTVTARAAIDHVRRNETPSFEGVFWYSFYEAKAASADECISEALRYISRGQENPEAIASPHRRKALLWQYLQKGRFLLVFDGLECLQLYAPAAPNHGQLQDAVLKDFLRGACQLSRSLVAITTRIAVPDLAGYEGYASLPLGSFSQAEALKYLRKAGLSGSDSSIEAASDAFGGHPLSLHLLADYLVRFCNGNAAVAQRFAMPSGVPVAERLNSLFESYWSRLDEDQRFFLTRLSAMRAGATEREFGVLVRPKELGGPGDPMAPTFRLAVARLEDTALLEVHHRGHDRFYTAPALLRMLTYDRMSPGDQTKAHLEWIRYTEGIPIPARPESVASVTPVIDLIYHCLRAGLYSQAWDLFKRKGKYNLSRQLIDWGAHEVGVEVWEDFRRRHIKIRRALYYDFEDFEVELIGFYATHLAASGRIARALEIVAAARRDCFDMPLCIRTRYMLLAGDQRGARRLHDRALMHPNSTYSILWSEALLGEYSGRATCLDNFALAIGAGHMLVRGYLGLLLWDYVNALLVFGKLDQAREQIMNMTDNVVLGGGASGMEPYLTAAKASLSMTEGHRGAANELFTQAAAQGNAIGDTYIECASLIGQATALCGRNAARQPFRLVGKASELAERALTLSTDAGEGNLERGFQVFGGRAHALLSRCAFLNGDAASARSHYLSLAAIATRSNSQRLRQEQQLLTALGVKQ
jgi:hypothetical protein